MALEAEDEAYRLQAGGQQQVMELETVKEILAKMFHARTGEVEETIKRRLVVGKGGGRCSA